MFIILRVIFALLAVGFAAAGMLTDQIEPYLGYSHFFLAAMFFVMGLSELRDKRKEMSFLMFGVSALLLIVVIVT
ncbi:DUF3953 domain-containing protein [Bacillus xiapuensis]|uniref:DUF3953 domain-containing protein n=1 Tax=Bacillus xiapuensis TaxID=2014075 RepID=UPI0012FDDEF6|nr:DUF3953 domain-containing protein [Bacillus xiapuensis]